MYKCIVVGTDGSETADKAVEVAAKLARDWDAALHIVTAFSAKASGMAAASGADLVNSGHAFHRDAATQVSQKAASTWADGLNTTPHAVGEAAPDAILDTAQKVGADLIVVGSRGMQGARRILGSVPNSVAHGASCAVLVVKTD